MGRKKKSGPRSEKTGRLLKMRDYGNERVQERRHLFDAMCIKDGKRADQCFDGIGQLEALDFLDGHHLDPELMRDTARKYGELYWRRNAATAPKTGQLDRSSFGKPSLIDTSADNLFEKWSDSLAPSPFERMVLEHVIVDYWFSDGTAGFVDRLVCTELVKRGKIPRLMVFEQSGDRETLAALLRACFILVDGVIPARFERRAA